MSSFRRDFITKPIFSWARGVLPSMSDTEREALEAGDVWWDADLFTGNPEWSKLLKQAPAELTAEEKAFLHGPVDDLCAMLDECMSVACMVASGMTAVAPTLEMKTSFLRPGKPGELRGVGRVIRWGRTIAFTEGEIYDAEGRLLAKATGTAQPTPFTNYKK